MKVAIDFDSVLVQRSGIPTSSEVWRDGPVKDSEDALWHFFRKGIDMYIFSVRGKEEKDKIREWLEKHDFPPIELITNEKQPGTALYIDDRALRFTNWQDVRKLLG